MDIIKICIIVIAAVILCQVIKISKNEYVIIIIIAISAILSYYIISGIGVVIGVFNRIQNITGIDNSYIKILIKILGITYIAQLTSGLCKDAGNNALAGQIEIFAKVSIIICGMPVMLSLIEFVTKS